MLSHFMLLGAEDLDLLPLNLLWPVKKSTAGCVSGWPDLVQDVPPHCRGVGLEDL